MTGYTIHQNVHIGANPQIGEYAILGVPPRDASPGELETRIGPGALIRSHTVIYAGNRIRANFQAVHGVIIREPNETGDVRSDDVVEERGGRR
jgi:UDP-3-O-[3-hydroxymyristoyl] glucosamine N-acyltransferase